jgi:hypothetical protein
MRKHIEKISMEELKPTEKVKPKIKTEKKESLTQLRERLRLYKITKQVRPEAIEEIEKKIQKKEWAIENMDRKKPKAKGKEIKTRRHVFFPETSELKDAQDL